MKLMAVCREASTGALKLISEQLYCERDEALAEIRAMLASGALDPSASLYLVDLDAAVPVLVMDAAMPAAEAAHEATEPAPVEADVTEVTEVWAEEPEIPPAEIEDAVEAAAEPPVEDAPEAIFTAADLGDAPALTIVPAEMLPPDDLAEPAAEAVPGQWPWEMPENALDETAADEIAVEGPSIGASEIPYIAGAEAPVEAAEVPALQLVDLPDLPIPPIPTLTGETIGAVVEPQGIIDAAESLPVGSADPAADPAEPASLDLNGYTCDDCVYVNTCPNQHQKAPSACGSFQWKST